VPLMSGVSRAFRVVFREYTGWDRHTGFTLWTFLACAMRLKKELT
jgi:hypothetical protein